MEELITMMLLIISVLSTSVQSQLSVTWNGTIVTGPLLIYFDELPLESCPAPLGDLNRPGALVCRSENQLLATWACPFRCGGTYLISTGRVLPYAVQVIRRVDNPSINGPGYNGLRNCRLGDERNGSIPVGVYQRGDGGEITTNQICFSFSSSGFALVGDTSGGPPESHTWTRNDEIISESSSFSISIAVNGDGVRANMESLYRSTLSVRGSFPGVYRYSVTNRATPTLVTESIEYSGEVPLPRNLTAQQIGFNFILISWTAPPVLFCDGFGIIVDNNTSPFSYAFFVSPDSVNTTTYEGVGIHSIELVVPPNMRVGPVEVTIRDTLAPILVASSLTATSVTISWTQPEFSLPIDRYTVSLTRVTGQGQALCSSVVDTRPAVTATGNSMAFTDLEEFSNYIVTVNATFSAFDQSVDVAGIMLFTTLTSGPTGMPRNIAPVLSSISSRSIGLAWDRIECSESNGIVFYYIADIQRQSEARSPAVTMDQNFTAAGLTPNTVYTFRVAGVNINGTGPFSDAITILTAEDNPGRVSDSRSTLNLNSIILTWRAPEEPNGDIISYEVTYRVNDSNPVTTNTTDLSATLTIPSLTPHTTVSNISITAYTRAGPGEAAHLHDVDTLREPPMVMNVELEIMSAGSVRVSWDASDIPEVTSYTVYYSRIGNGNHEEMLNAISNRVTVGGLVSDTIYVFQVAPRAGVGNGEVIIGERSATVRILVTTKSDVLTQDIYVRNISISTLAAFLLSTMLFTVIGITICYICNYFNKRKDNNKRNATRMTRGMQKAYSNAIKADFAMNEELQHNYS